MSSRNRRLSRSSRSSRLIALRLVEVDPVVHGDGDRGSHLIHERKDVVGVGVG